MTVELHFTGDSLIYYNNECDRKGLVPFNVNVR